MTFHTIWQYSYLLKRLLRRNQKKKFYGFRIRFKILILGLFVSELGPFGPNEEFHYTLILSAYHALTFSKEIRRKKLNGFRIRFKNVNFGHAWACLGPIWAHLDSNLDPRSEIDQNGWFPYGITVIQKFWRYWIFLNSAIFS